MNTSIAAVECVARVLAIMVMASLVSFEASAQTAEPPSKEQPDKQSLEKRLEDWREALRQAPLPNKGCFKSSYPNTQWQEVPCATPLKIPFIGNDQYKDIEAEVPAGSLISEVHGTFPSASGVTSESGKIANQGAPVPDAYSLQINTNFLHKTQLCKDSPNPECRGWEQFIYYNNGTTGGRAHTQYWLSAYNKDCPLGWEYRPLPAPNINSCVFYSNYQTDHFDNQKITNDNLQKMELSGGASASGDWVKFFPAVGPALATSAENLVDAAADWRLAEFGVYGPGGDKLGNGSEATFNAGATIVVKTRIIYGGTAKPNCKAGHTTAETNNLRFGPAPPEMPPGPAVLTAQSTEASEVASCGPGGVATTVGDPHLTTFGGVLYDFQAFGDFVLAETGSDFIVQARQVSAEQTWQNPNVAVNVAVATQMGSNKVAICLAPERLVIDGHTLKLEDGQLFSDPASVDISRKGNVYIVSGKDSGDSLRAEVHDGWIDVSVGLGRWPTNVHGLLANTTFEQPDQYALETRDGYLLPSPISYNNLFAKYGDSWRVSPKESLLSACGPEIEHGHPESLLHAQNLPQVEYDQARGVCTAAGVTESLLDACTLDVAVFGDETAAQAFVGTPAPQAVIQLTP